MSDLKLLERQDAAMVSFRKLHHSFWPAVLHVPRERSIRSGDSGTVRHV